VSTVAALARSVAAVVVAVETAIGLPRLRRTLSGALSLTLSLTLSFVLVELLEPDISSLLVEMTYGDFLNCLLRSCTASSSVVMCEVEKCYLCD
jgi:hypothetical protein